MSDKSIIIQQSSKTPVPAVDTSTVIHTVQPAVTVIEPIIETTSPAISITDNKTGKSVTVSSPVNQNIIITGAGIQGAPGPAGPSGSVDLSNVQATGSFTGSFIGDGSGLTGVGGDSFPYTGSAIISGSLEVIGQFTSSGLFYPTIDGDEKQLLSTDSEGRLSFDWADRTNIDVKNTSGVTLTIGTPIYITGYQGASIFQVAAASASDVSKMPAIGVLDQTLDPNDQGYATLLGALQGYDTSLFSVNDSLYVGEGVLTTTRPSGSALVQKIARVGNVASNGEITILGAGRTNDIPNILEGYAWVGNSDGVAVPTPTSSFGGTAILPVKDEGTQITPAVSSFDFIGNGVTATAVGNDVTITIPGGTSSIFPFIGDAQITGSLDVNGTGGDIFLIKSSSFGVVSVEETGAVTLTNDAPTMFLIRDTSFAPILAVSQSGVVIFATQSAELAGTAPNGGLYFTSSSLFVGLD